MRLRRVRLTLRQMMAGVAIVAAVLWVVERRERFRKLGQRHAIEMTAACSDVEIYLVACVGQGEGGEHAAERARLTRPLVEFMRYHYEMSDKYANAARRPWLAVASDPPLPPRPSREDFKSIFLQLEGYPYENLGIPDP